MKSTYMSILLVACLISTQAFGDEVFSLREDFQDTFTDYISCDTFSVTGVLAGHLTGIARFHNGVLVSDTDHVVGTGTLINQTSLKSIKGPFAQDFVFHPNSGLTENGLFLSFQSPQGGTFTLAAGRFFIDLNGNLVFAVGRADDPNFGFDPSQVCAALE